MMPDRYVKPRLLCAQDALVGNAEALMHVHHVVPALKRQQRVAVREVLRLLRRFLAVAVVRGVEIPNAIGLAQRFYQEGAVGPAGAGNFLEADVVRIQERFAVDGRPDGRMMAQQVRRVGNGERLLGGVDAVLVTAVQLALLLGFGHPDAPVGRLHDVKRRALVGKTMWRRPACRRTCPAQSNRRAPR